MYARTSQLTITFYWEQIFPGEQTWTTFWHRSGLPEKDGSIRKIKTNGVMKNLSGVEKMKIFKNFQDDFKNVIMIFSMTNDAEKCIQTWFSLEFEKFQFFDYFGYFLMS